ncbi:hypothetical protein MKX01_012097 [Papaver californicum]|nr:hypothetical protein MKX01_012097 [Papaver californicum]
MSYCHPHPPPRQHQQHSPRLMGSSPSYRNGFNLSNQHPRNATIPQQNSTASRFQFQDGVAILDVPASSVRVLPNAGGFFPTHDGVAVMNVSASNVTVLPTAMSTLQFQDNVAKMDDIFTGESPGLDDLLLSLREEIGSVRTGLSEEEISACMRTRVQHKLATSSCLNGSGANLEKEKDTCTICQADLAEYEKLDKIRMLHCGPEYHVECIKQWLLISKTCPICRQPALPRLPYHKAEIFLLIPAKPTGLFYVNCNYCLFV